ncbi:MAG TPA: DUF2279 domain-containing protein [Melioribacteraceae bacterium]|nr:DUF2279 domain-containing protein [Melioribacteraceae bacterium]
MRFLHILIILILGINNFYAQIIKNTDSSAVFIENDTLKNTLPISELNTSFKFRPFDGEDINTPILIGVSAAAIGVGISVHLYNYNAWWKNDRSSKFRILNDWNYALWIDKVGHFYGTAIEAHGLSAALDAANVPPEETAIISSVGAFLFQTFIEIEDGYGAQWGFSPGDFAADFLGASYHLAKYYFPAVRNFQPRVSYYPSEDYRTGKHKDGNISDDYEGQKYWLSLRMKELLPKSVSKYWPSFLMLSAGMGVKNLDGSGGGTREIFISFDIDWQEIPIPGKFGQFVKNTLNYFHLPLPGLKISPKAAFLVFCY